MNKIKNDLYDEKIKLYHYTSIETLYYILKNKTMRFNSLKNVDDLEEVASGDCETFGKYCYVSCYTIDKKDNIAMWNMYSKGMTGVCIEMDSDYYDQKIAGRKIQTELQKYNLLPVETPISPKIVGLYVEYSSNEKEIFPRVWTPEISKAYPVILNRVGKVKRDLWNFQQEARYFIHCYPKDWYPENATLDEAKNNIFNFNNSLEFIDIPIKDECIENFKIVVGPRASDFEYETVLLLAEKYGVAVENVSRSKLKIRK